MTEHSPYVEAKMEAWRELHHNSSIAAGVSGTLAVGLARLAYGAFEKRHIVVGTTLAASSAFMSMVSLRLATDAAYARSEAEFPDKFAKAGEAIDVRLEYY